MKNKTQGGLQILLIVFLTCGSGFASVTFPFKFFQEEKFSEAIAEIEKQTDRFPDYYTYKIFLLSFYLGQSYERQIGHLRLFYLAKKMKKFSQQFIKAHPNLAGGYIGLAQYYHYLPVWIGGSKKRSRNYMKKALASGIELSDRYLILLYYLNEEKNLSMSKQILDTLEARIHSGGEVLSPLEAWIRDWLFYQKGIYYFRQGEYTLCRSFLEPFLKRRPHSHWSYYILWKIFRLQGREASFYLNRAREIALDKKYRSFLSFLDKEEKKDRFGKSP